MSTSRRTTAQALDEWIERLEAADLFAFDTETTSLDAMQAELVGLSFCVEPGTAAYVPVGHDYPGAGPQLERDAVLARLRPLLEDADRPKVGQHIKYDMNVLSLVGVTVRGVAFDTMLESYVFNSTGSRHDMDTLALRHLGLKTTKYEEICGKGAKQILFSQVEIETATQYAAEDADITFQLYEHLRDRLAAESDLKKLFETVEMPLMFVLADMEAAGVSLDVHILRDMSHQIAALCARRRAVGEEVLLQRGGAVGSGQLA